MLKILGWIFKTLLVSAAILILGNIISWQGKTISDQVRTQISHAERSDLLGQVKTWASQVADDAQKGIKKSPLMPHSSRSSSELKPLAGQQIASGRSEGDQGEEISPSERQKLRALIQELNTSHHRN